MNRATSGVCRAVDLPTLRDTIKDLPVDQDVDVALFTSAKAELLASAKRDPLIPMGEFETNSAVAVRQALGGEDKVDTIRVGDRLFDVVSIPVSGPRRRHSRRLDLRLGNRRHRRPGIQPAYRQPDRPAGQWARHGLDRPAQPIGGKFAGLFSASSAGRRGPQTFRGIKKVLLGDEHYFCSAGKFASLGEDGQLGYLLLSSYEKPLRDLHNTQQILLLVSLLGILVGTAMVWFLVRKVTQPLRVLRDSAEAVGRGDFSQRVEVHSADECGELAAVFNQMTENLKTSREQLEQTVETLKTTQAQLVQSEKLSGIGEFVAGVAHELNNPLTSVMGFSELLKRADTNPQHQRHLDMIHKSAVRCQKIVQNLLSFARRHPPERKLSSINELVEAPSSSCNTNCAPATSKSSLTSIPTCPRPWWIRTRSSRSFSTSSTNHGRQFQDKYQSNFKWRWHNIN